MDSSDHGDGQVLPFSISALWVSGTPGLDQRLQEKLWNAAVEAGDRIGLDHPEFETSTRGHGRIDCHRVWSAPVPATTRFPHASRFVIVERESSTLDDVRVSIETRFYVTDLTEKEASVEHLLRLVRRTLVDREPALGS
jgi:hypothetical protein